MNPPARVDSDGPTFRVDGMVKGRPSLYLCKRVLRDHQSNYPAISQNIILTQNTIVYHRIVTDHGTEGKFGDSGACYDFSRVTAAFWFGLYFFSSVVQVVIKQPDCRSSAIFNYAE
jgi:hypothetical protein